MADSLHESPPALTIAVINQKGGTGKTTTAVNTGHGEDRQAHTWRILKPLEERILSTRIRRTEAVEKSQMETDDEERFVPAILQKQWNRGARDYRAIAANLGRSLAQVNETLRILD